MYKSYFHLTKNPFEITPDPAFLFPTRKHNDALAALYYAIRQRKGFVVLTGEVGTGKTLLIRCLLDYFKCNEIAYAYVFDSCLSPLEFLQFIAADFGMESSGKNKSELLHALGRYLISRHQQGLTTVLVVDEAHLLSPDVLEEIRLLTNLETSQEKLLQIVLAGQPQLADKLSRPSLGQLRQRISVLSSLAPLPYAETERYMEHRLRVAGYRSGTPFTAAAKRLIADISDGIPRNINNLCFGALSLGYALQQRTIDADVIREVVADLDLSKLASDSRASSIDEAAVLQKLKSDLDLVTLDKKTILARTEQFDTDARKDVPSVAEAQAYIQQIIQLLNNWQRSVN